MKTNFNLIIFYLINYNTFCELEEIHQNSHDMMFGLWFWLFEFVSRAPSWYPSCLLPRKDKLARWYGLAPRGLGQPRKVRTAAPSALAAFNRHSTGQHRILPTSSRTHEAPPSDPGRRLSWPNIFGALVLASTCDVSSPIAWSFFCFTSPPSLFLFHHLRRQCTEGVARGPDRLLAL